MYHDIRHAHTDTDSAATHHLWVSQYSTAHTDPHANCNGVQCLSSQPVHNPVLQAVNFHTKSPKWGRKMFYLLSDVSQVNSFMLTNDTKTSGIHWNAENNRLKHWREKHSSLSGPTRKQNKSSSLCKIWKKDGEGKKRFSKMCTHKQKLHAKSCFKKYHALCEYHLTEDCNLQNICTSDSSNYSNTVPKTVTPSRATCVKQVTLQCLLSYLL